MDDARPAPLRRLPRNPLLSIAPAALLPAWWEPAYTAITLAGLGCLGLAALIAARSRAADPWRRVARTTDARGIPASRSAAPRGGSPSPPGVRAPSPEPAAELAARHVARFALPRLPLVPTPGLSPVALHVVTGGDRDAIARGVVESAAQLLARGDSVLVVDAGRRLDLHAAFGRESRWGVAECLQGQLPLLGVVQSTGRSGLFLLARGDTGVEAPWRAFGRLLDDAAAQFARVIVAVDADCPPDAAPAFGPREIEGWWAGDGSRPRDAQAFTDRVGIPLLAMAVHGSLQTLLEGLARTAHAGVPTGWKSPAATRAGTCFVADRAAVAPAAAEPGPAALVLAAAPVSARRAAPARHPAAASARTGLAGAEPAAASAAGTPSGLIEAGEPIAPLVLPSDDRVAERLRFLTWARRLHGERLSADSAGERPGDALELVGAS